MGSTICRPLSQALKAPVPLHARPDDVKRFQRRFAYAFVQAGFYPPVAELVALGPDLLWGDAIFRFVDQPHGGITSLGMRIDEGERSAVYAIDFHDLTDDMAKLYDGVGRVDLRLPDAAAAPDPCPSRRRARVGQRLECRTTLSDAYGKRHGLCDLGPSSCPTGQRRRMTGWRLSFDQRFDAWRPLPPDGDHAGARAR